jgi:hypothetical protein
VVPPLHCLILVNLFEFASSRRRGLFQVGSVYGAFSGCHLGSVSFGLLEIFVGSSQSSVIGPLFWVSLTAVSFGPIVTWFCYIGFSVWLGPLIWFQVC